MEYSQKYTELQHIGKGSFGDVSLVKQKNTNDYFISKKIEISQMTQTEISKVKQEISLMERFQHQCIVTYIESFIEPKNIIIIMEYCAGGDLDQFIQSHARTNSYLPEQFLRDWTKQLVSALGHVHSLRIIHRDIKPSNIFLTVDGKLKLGDFGVSKPLCNTNDVASTVIGTPLFMSPEVINGLAYTNKCDIWALGCVLYEICTFNKPFMANSLMALAIKIFNEDPDEISSAYSEKFKRVIMDMLDKDPKKRPSCKEIFSLIGEKDEFCMPIKATRSEIFVRKAESFNIDSSINLAETYGEEYFDDFENYSESENYEPDFNE